MPYDENAEIELWCCCGLGLGKALTTINSLLLTEAPDRFFMMILYGTKVRLSESLRA